MWRVVADQRSLSEGRRNDRADGEVGEGEHVTVATLLLPSQGAYCRLKLTIGIATGQKNPGTPVMLKLLHSYEPPEFLQGEADRDWLLILSSNVIFNEPLGFRV
ncbi:hypothetical protein CRG98_026965 [Punica granatum]|uniref:Uncharacterized protein n=1 Tax=Punica granatum TaxID=22663 RepID=A0A2I0J8Q8_PUNGR|nr:hypothetical protein CRG98_026965 [Punica granatum]